VKTSIEKVALILEVLCIIFIVYSIICLANQTKENRDVKQTVIDAGKEKRRHRLKD